MEGKTKFMFLFLIVSLILVSGVYAWDSSCGFWDDCDDVRINRVKETTEFKKTTEQEIKDDWFHERKKTTITEKTEYEREEKTPIYHYRYYNSPKYDKYAYYPSSWRYKERYHPWDYRYDYYYKPRYDYNLGHYNWRY